MRTFVECPAKSLSKLRVNDLNGFKRSHNGNANQNILSIVNFIDRRNVKARFRKC